MTVNAKHVAGIFLACIALCTAIAPAAQATTFTAATYPTSISGWDGFSTHTFSVAGGKLECPNTFFNGTISAASETQTLTPSYATTGCTMFGLSATVALNGCDYLFNVGGTMNIVCPEGKDITLSGGGGACVVHIGAQNGVNGISYKNTFGNEIELTLAANNIKAVVTKNSFLCPVSGGSYTNATYSGKELLGGGGIKLDVG